MWIRSLPLQYSIVSQQIHYVYVSKFQWLANIRRIDYDLNRRQTRTRWSKISGKMCRYMRSLRPLQCKHGLIWWNRSHFILSLNENLGRTSAIREWLWFAGMLTVFGWVASVARSPHVQQALASAGFGSYIFERLGDVYLALLEESRHENHAATNDCEVHFHDAMGMSAESKGYMGELVECTNLNCDTTAPFQNTSLLPNRSPTMMIRMKLMRQALIGQISISCQLKDVEDLRTYTNPARKGANRAIFRSLVTWSLRSIKTGIARM